MALPENVPSQLISLDRPRRIALTLGAIRRLQEQTGRPITELSKLLEEGRLDHLHRLIWSCLVNGDREGVTPEDMEEMLHPGNLQDAIEAFASLMEASTPKGAEGNVPTPAKKATGKRSR